MFKCFKNNRIFKRQASMMLVFAMLISMMAGLWTAPALEVQAAETGINWTKVNITKTTAAGYTLANGYMYTVTEDVTLTGAAATSSVNAVNGLKVAAGATVVLYIPKDVTLTVQGGNGYYTKPGAAGIEVPSTSTLIIIGGGTLSATGGNAGQAGSGEKGGNGSIASNTGKSGYGGAGGSGGGGAGAGIGTNGGAGGAGGTRTGIRTQTLGGCQSGIAGNKGSNGTSASALGTVRIAATISGTYKGGTSTGNNGSGGGKGSTSTYSPGNRYMACGGGGGGGGGVGYAANNIGYGGSGGPGGGSGGSGGVDAAPNSGNLGNLCEGYGGKGSTSSNGGTSGVSKSASYFGCVGGSGGAAGTANNNLVTSYTYKNPGLSNCASINYNVTIRNTAVADIQDHNITLTLGLAPEALAIVDKYGYDFIGYYTEENGAGAQPFDANGSVIKNTSYADDEGLWLGTENLILYAHYLPKEESQHTYSFEPLNNVVNEDGEVTKKVTGDSKTDNGTNTALQVELTESEQPISVYKIADVVWDDVASIYEYPAWISDVKTWINNPVDKSEDFLKNKSAFANPSVLASASSDVQENFFIDIANAGSLLSQIGVVKAPDYRSSDSDGEETKHYALFENLTFGTYLICAPGFSPVVKNIYPDKDASGYSVPTLVKATLKGGGLNLVKKINGHDIDTVAVGDTVNFEISFNTADITADSEIILTDVMSNAFLLESVSFIEISYGPEGNSPLTSGIEYSIDTTPPNEDGSTNILITFDAKKLQALSATKIYVRYSAIVTKNVKYNSESNYNTAILQVDHLSSEDTVHAYTYGLTVVKADGNSADSEEGMKYLSDAEFNLFKEKYIYIGGEFAGAFDEESGIDYAKEAVTEPDADFIEDCKKDPKQYYVYEYEAEASGSIVVDQNEVQYEKDAAIVRIYELVTKGEGFSDDNGTITSVASQEGVTIGGLDSGSYILVETSAPFGYNTLAEVIYFEINRMTEDEAKLKTAGSLSAFYEMNETEKLNESGKLELVVLNYRGLTLPSTGGNGILLFTIFGTLLMIMAISIAVVRSRKMNTYDF